MGLIQATQRNNSTQHIGNILKCLKNYFDFQKKRIETAPKLNAIIKSKVDVNEMEVVGYLVGNKVDRCKGMTLNHFEYVEYLMESKNPIKGDTFHHFMCRNRNMVTIVICKKK